MRAGSAAQWQALPGMCKALGSVPSMGKEEKQSGGTEHTRFLHCYSCHVSFECFPFGNNVPSQLYFLMLNHWGSEV